MSRHMTSTLLGRLATVTILGLLLNPAPVAAEADGPDYYRVTGVAPTDVLSIRATPDPGAAQVGSIPPGADCVRNLGCRGGLSFEEYSTLSKAEQAERLRHHPRWCKIEYQGIEGWVAGRYLAEGGCR
ncbi:SH3 domain-containing protein [Thiocystis minor]|uniref:SH3 domain-containing protein n=1 Tax=Thiocystis minor TaxID=61597 RepID=UPI001F5C70EE|nr:SH3 domain-containing protein [Thiocystis minor]